jgi:hypothetical protein
VRDASARLLVTLPGGLPDAGDHRGDVLHDVALPPGRALHRVGLRRTGHRDKANLDITWLRDPNAENSDNLPLPEVIAQEIVDDLQAALNESAAVAEAFKAVEAVQGEGTT